MDEINPQIKIACIPKIWLLHCFEDSFRKYAFFKYDHFFQAKVTIESKQSGHLVT